MEFWREIEKNYFCFVFVPVAWSRMMEILEDVTSVIIFIQVPMFGVMLALIIYQMENVSTSIMINVRSIALFAVVHAKYCFCLLQTPYESFDHAISTVICRISPISRWPSALISMKSATMPSTIMSCAITLPL